VRNLVGDSLIIDIYAVPGLLHRVDGMFVLNRPRVLVGSNETDIRGDVSPGPGISSIRAGRKVFDDEFAVTCGCLRFQLGDRFLCLSGPLENSASDCL
jgi:hypothetical protein